MMPAVGWRGRGTGTHTSAFPLALAGKAASSPSEGRVVALTRQGLGIGPFSLPDTSQHQPQVCEQGRNELRAGDLMKTGHKAGM
jgi:hypothetical protein